MKNQNQIWYYYHDKEGNTCHDISNNIFAYFDSGEAMQIAVCDDEKLYIDLFTGYIKNSLAMYGDDFGEVVIDRYTSGEDLVHAYDQGTRYDVIFLDIKMKSLNGFETAKGIREIDNNTTIIFITSLADYIFNSFEYRPFWFLIKPVSEEKFKHVFLKALVQLKQTKFRQYSFFTREEGLVCLEIGKILYLESVLRRINLYTVSQQFTYYANIGEEEEKLKVDDFIRIHKGYLVNMAYIHRINKNNVVLKNSVVLPLSEHRFKTVFDNFTSYLARCLA